MSRQTPCSGGSEPWHAACHSACVHALLSLHWRRRFRRAPLLALLLLVAAGDFSCGYKAPVDPNYAANKAAEIKRVVGEIEECVQADMALAGRVITLALEQAREPGFETVAVWIERPNGPAIRVEVKRHGLRASPKFEVGDTTAVSISSDDTNEHFRIHGQFTVFRSEDGYRCTDGFYQSWGMSCFLLELSSMVFEVDPADFPVFAPKGSAICLIARYGDGRAEVDADGTIEFDDAGTGMVSAQLVSSHHVSDPEFSFLIGFEE